MFDKDAIEALQEAEAIRSARDTVVTALDGFGVAALPEHHTLRDLESFMPMRRRLRGSMTTSVLKDFASYSDANAEKGATVFVDADSMAAKAVLNLGETDEPGHADNVAKLQLKTTAAYTALRVITNNGCVSQVKAAEFLEDWPEHVQCFNDAGEIPAPKAIAAVRRLSIDSYRKLESSEQSLSSSKSAFESVQATSIEPIPTYIYFKCVPYQELGERLFVMRLGVQTGGDKPTITLRIAKAELHQEEMASELADKVRDALKKFPVHIGTYQASN